MLLKACLNGSRLPGEHPSLPLSAQDLAQVARAVQIAGAGAVHIHPRRADGSQTLEAQVCREAVGAIQVLCPGLPVGLSTGAWMEPNISRRVQLVSQWTFGPDFASVNFSEPGAFNVAVALRDLGIGIEAGLSSISDASLLVRSGFAKECLRLLLEPDETEPEAALTTVKGMIAYLDSASVEIPRLLHGGEKTAWPLLHRAFQLGYDIRIGLEDTLLLPDGRMAQDNAELVTVARSFLS